MLISGFAKESMTAKVAVRPGKRNRLARPAQDKPGRRRGIAQGKPSRIARERPPQPGKMSWIIR
jgi:hypothetical protein